ncbi:hypothetical protein [Absidia glauca]|uniref:Uncharacterized protein n=1 Tax=Absidia glauca TaxID=4829 RepID=A0A163J4L8_ABSGL|nr:hypothetical protein [Absidia glauca]
MAHALCNLLAVWARNLANEERALTGQSISFAKLPSARKQELVKSLEQTAANYNIHLGRCDGSWFAISLLNAKFAVQVDKATKDAKKARNGDNDNDNDGNDDDGNENHQFVYDGDLSSDEDSLVEGMANENSGSNSCRIPAKRQRRDTQASPSPTSSSRSASSSRLAGARGRGRASGASSGGRGRGRGRGKAAMQ